jgi:hypothetical protein
MTRDIINALVATTCDGYTDARLQIWESKGDQEGLIDHPNGDYWALYTATGLRSEVIDYLHDYTMVVTLLEKHFIAFQWNPCDRSLGYLQKRIGQQPEWKWVFGSIPLENGAFCLAGCLALLKSHNVEIPA